MAHAYMLEACRVSEGLSPLERYGITSRLRRASVSIAVNLVEDLRKRGLADKLRYFNIAQDSADECLYHLVLVRDLPFADTGGLPLQLEEVCRLLPACLNAIEK